jgi:signal transduction histidine kinase
MSGASGIDCPMLAMLAMLGADCDFCGRWCVFDGRRYRTHHLRVDDAVDAVLESKPIGKNQPSLADPVAVRMTWILSNGQAEITIEDDGPGVANPANLFIPFFTTKPGGSGIGLVLSRQIAEAHGGSLILENRKERSGCVARLRLPANKEPVPARRMSIGAG